MTTYAASTSVSADRSRAEIEKTLARYGAARFAYGWEEDFAVIQFVAHERHVRFILPMPDRGAKEFIKTPTGRPRTKAQAEQAYEQAVRAKWRSLALIVKAKLEAVETGLVSFEREFAMWTVLPNGQTAGDWIEPQIAEAYASGEMPPFLPGISAPSGPKAIG